MWIKRDISSVIEDNDDPVQILRGPRQCGKTSLFLELDPSYKEISLDDPAQRELAQEDPELFLKQHGNAKLFIDEAQYAPNLFPSIKRRVDLANRDQSKVSQTIIRLTGSNQIMMDRTVKESLVGRASFFDLNTLTVAEILNSEKRAIQEILYRGGWPKLYSRPTTDVQKYLDDYINTYIEKDIILSAGIQKKREFLKATRLIAGRVGQLLDFTSLANDVGVDSKTLKEWVSVLETMHIISLVQPYFTNLSKRLIKTPKLYFLDTGLACRLQGWTASQAILTSPQQGPLFENLVFCEIFKTIQNFKLPWTVHQWRSKDGEEIDFLIEMSPVDFLFVESKVSPTKLRALEDYPEVRKVFKHKLPKRILCHQEGSVQTEERVPISQLRDFLLSYTA